MYCPQCGQQQVTDSLRFCSRCGFPLEAVLQVLATGGMLPPFTAVGSREPSPRRKGVKQGAMLLLLGVVLVPLLGILSSFNAGNLFDILAAMGAVFFFLGGLIRMLFAALFEEGAPRYRPVTPFYAPPAVPVQQFQAPPRVSALPPTPVPPPFAWRSRPNTAEIAQPPSITENTTRLLDKDDPAQQ